jgi:hypothetical protein
MTLAHQLRRAISIQAEGKKDYLRRMLPIASVSFKLFLGGD